jgi:hypothetical protein
MQFSLCSSRFMRTHMDSFSNSITRTAGDLSLRAKDQLSVDLLPVVGIIVLLIIQSRAGAG